jgi:hypothetical protein
MRWAAEPFPATKKMKPENTLLLDLDERNLAHFLSALALAALAARVEGDDRDSRRCWWPEPGQFALETEHPRDAFRAMLFANAHDFLSAMAWQPGLLGVEHGVITSVDEIGVNPFVPLSGNLDERPLLRAFSAKVIPQKVLPDQIAELRSPAKCSDWLNQLASGAGRRVAQGVSSWGYDCRVNVHASDAGISSDAEGSGRLDPIFPAIELLSVAGAAFFAPAHAWAHESGGLRVTAWTVPWPLNSVAFASADRIHGLASRSLTFLSRGSAHGKGGSFRFFPLAFIQTPIP